MLLKTFNLLSQVSINSDGSLSLSNRNLYSFDKTFLVSDKDLKSEQLIFKNSSLVYSNSNSEKSYRNRILKFKK